MRGFESSLPSHYDFRRAVSSRGPGRSPLKAETGVRIPVPLPTFQIRFPAFQGKVPPFCPLISVCLHWQWLPVLTFAADMKRRTSGELHQGLHRRPRGDAL
jgi:hypothetical protein